MRAKIGGVPLMINSVQNIFRGYLNPFILEELEFT
jgi:hypothetical protein